MVLDFLFPLDEDTSPDTHSCKDQRSRKAVALSRDPILPSRDNVQLETAVSTISQEYLLEFTSEYGISEDLHPKLPCPEERIVDFSKGKDEMPARDTYSAEAVTILNTHRTPIQKQPKALMCLVGLSRRYYLRDDVYPTFLHDDDRGGYGFVQFDSCSETYQGEDWYSPPRAHEVPLLTVTTSRVIEMEDSVTTTDSFGVPSPIKRSLLDFANENPSQQSTRGNGTKDHGQGTVALEVLPPENVATTEVTPEAGLAEEIAAMGPRLIKERRKRGNDGVDTNAPPKVLKRDHVESQPTQSTIRGKSLAAMAI
nr:hypothetical protein [Tanacetum cinerariifolium]